jgi:ferredoxin
MKKKHLHIVSKGDICLSCGACVGICPLDTIYLNEWRIEFDEVKCTRCSICVNACPVGAISIGPETCTHSNMTGTSFPGR